MRNFLIKTFIVIFTILICPFLIHADNTKPERIFYITNSASGLESLKQHTDKIDVLIPQGYEFDNTLTVTGSLSPDIKTAVLNTNVKLMPMLANKDFKQETVHQLITSTTAQDTMIAYLIAEAQTNAYIGWQFDIENISYMDKDLYTAFITKTATALHTAGLQLSITAVARINDKVDNFYKNWSGVFDYKKLSDAVDFISIMAYDDPNSKGPTAGIPFVKKVISYLKDKVPVEKISLGIPFYYWNWKVTPAKRMDSGSYTKMQKIQSQYKYTVGYNKTYKVPYMKYSIKKKKYILWYEDAQSIQTKLNLVSTNKLRGFSAWVLGVEDPKIWSVID